MSKTPYMAISNGELQETTAIKGDTVVKGELKGTIKYSVNAETNEESNTMGFITVNSESYIVSIKDRLLPGWRKL